MKVLVTAGNTMTMIDKVRGLTNVFRGTTGLDITLQFIRAGHEVVLLTSDAYRAKNVLANEPLEVWRRVSKIVPYRSYEDLLREMHDQIPSGNFDLIVHSAAVSDYAFKQAYVPSEDPHGVNDLFQMFPGTVMVEPIPSQGKTSSEHERLFIELVPTEKLVDKIRRDWGFKGVLVKFKLEVGKTDHELVVIARASRAHSDADLIVANCLEWSRDRAYVIDRDGFAQSVRRDEIASAILRRIQ